MLLLVLHALPHAETERNHPTRLVMMEILHPEMDAVQPAQLRLTTSVRKTLPSNQFAKNAEMVSKRLPRNATMALKYLETDAAQHALLSLITTAMAPMEANLSASKSAGTE